MRINLVLTPTEEQILLDAVRKQGYPATPTGVLRAFFWAGIREYQAQGKLPEEFVSRTSRKREIVDENCFQRLLQTFLEHNELVEGLLIEYPGTIEMMETEEDLNKWLEETFRLRKDYQAKAKALLSSLPLTHLHNGE